MCAVHYSTAQYSTVQHSTVQYRVIVAAVRMVKVSSEWCEVCGVSQFIDLSRAGEASQQHQIFQFYNKLRTLTTDHHTG